MWLIWKALSESMAWFTPVFPGRNWVWAQMMGCAALYMTREWFNRWQISHPKKLFSDFQMIGPEEVAPGLTTQGSFTRNRNILECYTWNQRLSTSTITPKILCSNKSLNERDTFELWCWRRLLRLSDCKEIKSVNSKGNQPWIFIGSSNAEAPILWPPDAKNWLIGKDPDAGKDWGQEEKRDDRGWDGWMVSSTQWTWMSLSKFWKTVKDREAWCAAVHGVAESDMT